MVRYSLVSPVSPLKKTAWRCERITSEDHSVELRFFRPRPEKCCDGVAVTVSALFGNWYDSHQSSSAMRSGGTPQNSRCAPTPREVTNGTSRAASSRIVG